MMKIMSKIIILLIIFISVLNITIFSFEDELFKFDTPTNYANMSYQGIYLFADTENSKRGFSIYAYEDVGLKKPIWSITDSDLSDIIDNSEGKAITIDRKSKLGKERTIKIVMNENEKYMDIYLLASNKYVYIVIFTAETFADLDNEDYKMIQNSFEIKDDTTNPVIIYILLILGVLFVKFVLLSSPPKEMDHQFHHYHKSKIIDYKNMTEEDLNNFKHQ